MLSCPHAKGSLKTVLNVVLASLKLASLVFRLPFMAMTSTRHHPRLAMKIAINLLCQRAADAVGLRQVVDAGGLHAA